MAAAAQQKLDDAIEQAKSEVGKVQQETEQVSDKFAQMEPLSESPVDIENASLDSVHAHGEEMNGNIAELICQLDEVTAGFGAQFERMQSKTWQEKAIGWLSSSKSESMRESRIRNSDIESNLQDLISQSNSIIELLQSQLSTLKEQKQKVQANLERTLEAREQVTQELSEIKDSIEELDPQIIELQDKYQSETDPTERSRIDSELQKLNERYNELVQQEQVKMSRSQTLEKYIEKGKTWVDSLQNQESTQMVLIDKLKTDTEQRTTLYDALNRSLKTAQQQDVAHKINEIGTETDKQAQGAMAAIGSATQHRMASMMEAHEGNMAFAKDVLERKRKSDERFARRFGEISRKHEAADYGANGQG